ncbi:MAG: type IV toxin-antitoxin system AbiEi family antitoxin [Acidobacteria bacterium]|nr:type IV toxin-antitoxin system AbiEi family antitoxin [Acidobacteriota bacterium]
MRSQNSQPRVEEWINRQIAYGRNAFSLDRAEKELPQYSETAIKRSLNRLSRKGKIVSAHKGYYVIVTPQYSSRGILPPALFIDGLMRFLERSYYIGLLNAAAFYGAAHQVPQEFFVFTSSPPMRPTVKKGIKVNYITRKEIPENLLEERKTETGTIKISSPELTAADLLQHMKRVGGLNRVVEVLSELTDAVRIEKLDKEFVQFVPTAVVQRLGYLFEKAIGAEALADELFKSAELTGGKFFPVPLNPTGKKRGFPIETRWNIIVNELIDSKQ